MSSHLRFIAETQQAASLKPQQAAALQHDFIQSRSGQD